MTRVIADSRTQHEEFEGAAFVEEPCSMRASSLRTPRSTCCLIACVPGFVRVTLKLPPIYPCHLVRSSAHIGSFSFVRPANYCQQMYILQPCHASQKLRVPNWHRKSDRRSYRDVRELAFNLMWRGKTPLKKCDPQQLQ